MESVFRTISKQTAKIIKILTKLTQNKPDNSEQIDLALYAAIQIEKCIGKYMDSPQVSEVMEGGSRVVGGKGVDGCDAMLEVAWANIENFRESTAKLQSKINVLINQSELHAKKHHHHSHQEPPRVHHEQKIKPAKIHRKKQPAAEHQSRSLSEIDHSILKISNQITTLMARDRIQGHSQQQSEVQRYVD